MEVMPQIRLSAGYPNPGLFFDVAQSLTCEALTFKLCARRRQEIYELFRPLQADTF